MNRVKIVFAVLFSMVLGSGTAHAVDVGKWNVFEVSLTASGSSSYLNMPGDNTSPGFVVGTFTGPGGIVIKMDGFWDGGQIWKIRMAPTVTGTWTYTTSSTDSGLNAKPGSFNCTASSSKGFIRVNPAYPHSFMYADGTPFFLVGDTAWDGRSWMGNHFSTGKFQDMVNGRADHGFNVFTNCLLGYGSINIDGTVYSENEGGKLNFDGVTGNQINPAFFESCDDRIVYMNSKGMLPLVMICWANPNFHNVTKLVRFQRYLIARWAAYDTFWYFVMEFEEWNNHEAGLGTNIVRELGNSCDLWDPYCHPTSTHTLDTTSSEVGNDAWLDFNSQQRRPYTTMTSDFNDYLKPVVVNECYYEWLDSAWLTNWFATHPGSPIAPWYVYMDDPIIRQSLWKTQLSGAYNSGYQLCDPAGALTDTWLANLDSPSANWHKYLKNFFVNKTQFWKLIPNNVLIQAGDAVASADIGNEYVLYLSSGAAGRTVTLNLSRASGTMNVEWYNPINGNYTIAPTVTGGGSRTFTAPDTNDWVLYIAGGTGTPTAVILDDPLLSSPPTGATREVTGGQFQDGGGWKTTSGSYIRYDLGTGGITKGELKVYVTNWDPFTQVSSEKHTPISMLVDTIENYPEVDPGFFWFRTGTNYDLGHGMKVASHGPGETTKETRVLTGKIWNTTRVYEFKAVWDTTSIEFYLDGVLLDSQSTINPVPLRYLYIGNNNYHSYPTMVGYITQRVIISLLQTPISSITVTAPNGGENWTANSWEPVTWSSLGTVGNVNIDISTNAGTSWTNLVTNTANDGTQVITVPNTPSTTCRIRVQEPDGSPTDMSNANFTIASATALITNLSVADTANAADWSIRANIQTGDLQYGDRTYTLTSVPTSIAGSAWIRTANDSRAYTTDPVVTFTVTQNADVYVAHDDRITTKPSWMDGTWTLITGEDIISGCPFSLYKKTYTANSSVLLGNNGSTGYSMYMIIVKTQ